jgi:tRNA threonylcarbamoyladenosine biosynthesis protein TsaB
MILSLRADSPEVFIAIYSSGKSVASKQWQAGRELSVQLLQVIEDLSKQAGVSLSGLEGVVVYEGPGSYTGLRISISVANSLGYAYSIPIVGCTGTDWISEGMKKLHSIVEFTPLVPVYGGQVHTTQPKK